MHACVSYRLIGGGALLPWKLEKKGREVRFRAGGPFIVNDEVLAVAADRRRGGPGHMLENDVAVEIADGRLIEVLEEWFARFPARRLNYPGRNVTPALRTLVSRVSLLWQLTA